MEQSPLYVLLSMNLTAFRSILTGIMLDKLLHRRKCNPGADVVSTLVHSGDFVMLNNILLRDDISNRKWKCTWNKKKGDYLLVLKLCHQKEQSIIEGAIPTFTSRAANLRIPSSCSILGSEVSPCLKGARLEKSTFEFLATSEYRVWFHVTREKHWTMKRRPDNPNPSKYAYTVYHLCHLMWIFNYSH